MFPKRATLKQKSLVAKRAGQRCEYCFAPVDSSPHPFQVDHIIPLSKGGLTELDNLAFSCGCNLYKGDHTHAPDPQTNRLVALFHPRQQNWSEHFDWSKDFLKIIGLTPTGRATIAALRMNRKGLIKLRRLLIAAGEHPPTD